MDGFTQRLGRIAIVLLVLAGVAGPEDAAAQPERTAHVLVVYSSSRAINTFDEFHTSLLASIRNQPDVRIEIHTEFYDELVGNGESYETALDEYLRQKYASVKIELVVGVSGPAARTATRIRERVFPDARLVYGAVDSRVIAAGAVPEGTPGVAAYLDIRKSVEIALACHPGTKRVAFVIGATQIELAWRQRFVTEIAAADPSLEAIDLAGLDAETLIERLSSLPDDTVVIWGAYFRDAAGVAYPSSEILGRASSESSAPIYGVFDYTLGRGIVGGCLTSYATCGDLTGKLLLRLLSGESPDLAGVPPFAPNVLTFDSRELERWGVPESRLPAGAVVKFREPSVWDLYGLYIVGALVLFIAQALLIAGLLVQRSRRFTAQRSVEEKIAFEMLISDVSARLANAPTHGVESMLAEALESARRQLGADRLSLAELRVESGDATILNSAAASGVQLLAGHVDLTQIPELLERLKGGQAVRIERLGDIEASMPDTRDALERAGVTGMAAIPLQIGGSTVGVLGMARMGQSSAWSDEVIARLQIFADIFANALERRTAAEHVRKSEELSHAVLGSISAQVCVIDRSGHVVAGNDAWQRSTPVSGVDVACTLMRRHCGVQCESATSCEHADSTQARNGIRSVIDGELPSFSMEYRLAQTMGDTWHVMTVERLRLPEGGAVVSNLNITARKRAELEAEQRRQELMHFSRVSAMGELAASLAHELNQPLTGVLTNAQAAVRFLDVDPPNLTEVREILADIIEDDRRAGEVIRRLRAMLQSGAVESSDVDLNDVVTNVVRLVASDAILRDITLFTDLEPDLSPIAGDSIQMQQVVLNLIVNAMDAMRAEPVRHVTVRTEAEGPQGVRLTVSDTGPGIEHDRLGKVFQPFFTTKSEGLGMGLSIARTIVEAHGGVLWAENNSDGGASFLFRLPVSKAAAVSA